MFEYDEIARSIQARHLQVSIASAVHFPPEADARAAEAILAERQFDQAPVLRGGKVLGTVRRADLTGKEQVRDAVKQLHPDEIISADAPVSSVLHWLEATPCLYVLDGRDVSGFVVAADLNKQPARLYFYLMIATFELALAQRLRRWSMGDEGRIAERMADDIAMRVADRRAQARSTDTDTDVIAHMTFSELVRVADKVPEVRASFGYRSGSKWKEVRSLNQLRNVVMHPARDLIGGELTFDEVLRYDTTLRRLLDAIETRPFTP